MIVIWVALVTRLFTTQAPDNAAYIRLLDRYAAGDYSVVRPLAMIPREEFGVLDTTRLLRIAAVAHADAAIAMRPTSTALESRQQLTFAQSDVEKLQSKQRGDPVARRWWLLAIGYLHAQRNFREAIPAIDRARALNGDTADLLLALGMTHESWWSASRARVAGASPSPDLGEAEKAYRAALAKAPSILEARVRLARVRALRGSPDETLRLLDGMPQTADVRLLYLARLFQGDAHERMGSLVEAQHAYEAAAALIPRAQSAEVALAHVRHLQGARWEAAETMRNSAADQAAEDDADPWFWYSVGYAAHIDADLAELRRLIRQ